MHIGATKTYRLTCAQDLTENVHLILGKWREEGYQDEWNIR